MTRDFPGKPGLALAIVLAVATGPAAGQETAYRGPIPLFPDGAPATLDAPPPALPDEPGEADTTGDKGISDIEIGELDELDLDSGGILEGSMGGLGIDMWAGSDRARLLRLLPQLPAGYESPTLHDLARRLLLSAAIAPMRGETGPAASLIALRIERLAAMGLTGAVAEMMGLARAPETDGLLMRLHVDNRLLLDDNEDACQGVAAGAEALDQLYRNQVAVLCTVLSGDRETAGIGANLLREGGELDDPAFFSLADAFRRGKQRACVSKRVKALPRILASTFQVKVQKNIFFRLVKKFIDNIFLLEKSCLFGFFFGKILLPG